MFSKLRRGEKQSNKNDRKMRRKHDASTPRDIVVPSKLASNDSGRPTLRKANTTNELYHRSKRAISPNTLMRMQKALGFNSETVVSAPTILYEDAKSISSVHSAPASNDVPRIVDKKTAKRHSMESASLRNLSNSRGQQSMRSLGQSKSTHRGISRSLGKIDSSRRHIETKKEICESVGLRTCESLCTQQLVSQRKSSAIKANVRIPKGMVTIVITDIQGSTMMWEENASAMKDALDVHDAIIRKCYVKQSGYEITTEGDSFHLAFHHPLDALSFCLDCQHKLYNANWSKEILTLSNAKFDAARAMRGLRVRMGLHHGPTTSKIHEVTRRIYYNGEGLELAKAMEKASHGGQIVTNVETWRAVSGMAERYLGSPQILDLGVHELTGKGEAAVYTKSLVQLVPKQYAFDYFTFRGTKLHKNHERPEGRTFPPPKTKRQICAAFFDAPYLNNRVTIVFVNTVLSEQSLDKEDLSDHSKKLAKTIRSLLIRTNPPGYECQEDNGSWMLAFHSLETAIHFGLNLIEKLEIAKSPLVTKVGVHSGVFTSMGPHTVIGKTQVVFTRTRTCR